MSTLKVDNIRHNSATSDAITMASDGTCTAKITGITGGGALSSRRLNINGSFLVWQRFRGATTSIAVTDGSNEGYQAADRMLFKFGSSAGGACTINRSTDVPTRSGFVYSYKIDVTTANSSPSTNDHVQNEYLFEGQDILSSGWDYKDPNSYLTISLYLKTNKSGNPKLPLTFRLYDRTNGNYRYYTEDVTIVGTDWGRYSISIPGDASAGDIQNTTTAEAALFICWSFGSGMVGTTGAWRTDGDRASSNSANFFDSTSNEMYMTGLQIEVGNTMTSYEHRTYAEELIRCQRYYNKVYDVGGQSGEKPFLLGTYLSGSELACVVQFPQMRGVPSLEITNGSNKFMIRRNNASDNFNTLTMRYGTTTTAELYTGSNVSGTAGQCGIIRGADTDVYIAFKSEI